MSKLPRVTLILAATNPALGIGKGGTLPWRLKREMKYFKDVTTGGTVLMGRKTWESIPLKFRPLPNRQNVVISRDANADFGEQVLTATSVEKALELADSTKPVFVIGGGQIYEASLPYADRILLTLIEDPEHKIECDTFFAMDREQWQKQDPMLLQGIVGEHVVLAEGNQEVEGVYQYEYTSWEKRATAN